MAEYQDRYGLAVTTCSGEAFDAYAEAFDLALAQCEGAAGLLERAITADDAFSLAWSALSLQQRSRGDIPAANASLQRAPGQCPVPDQLVFIDRMRHVASGSPARGHPPGAAQTPKKPGLILTARGQTRTRNRERPPQSPQGVIIELG